jgi:putative hydrolase of HD superfamily
MVGIPFFISPILMEPSRLNQQLQFILEIDRLKQILRQTLLTDSSRRENSAEHSWHIAIMAMVLADYAPPGVDLNRAIKMLLIHDVVEIDAGDTFCYDLQNHNKADREERAAIRLFGLLPLDQAQEFRQLWDEFEAQKSITAQFAAALDRIQPFLHNRATHGGTWKLHNISREQVLQRMQPVAAGAPELWTFIQTAIEECVERGDLRKK